MQERLKQFIEASKLLLEKEMESRLKEISAPEPLKASMLYSIRAGGKRIRPILLLASHQVFASSSKSVIAPSIALELIHTYSLIHDDLPAMDDDDYRRGMPTNHKVYDEATAILAGDGLLTYSFELIARDPHLSDQQKVKLIQLLAECSGSNGMVGGQILDMQAENNPVTLEELESIHTKKTGDLLKFAVYAGAYLADAKKEVLDALLDYAYYLGLIFQVQDDILDITGTEAVLGKPVGSDVENQKSTYPSLLGLEGAKKQKATYVQKAKEALYRANADESLLMDITDYFSHRAY